jgi:hypothetical protein
MQIFHPHPVCYSSLKTGNLELISNAMVREVITDKAGLATGVSYVNKEDMQEYQVSGKTIVLGASACESARLCLTLNLPYILMDLPTAAGCRQIPARFYGASQGGMLPQLLDRKRFNEDGVGSIHIYGPWMEDNKKLDFPRGYHIEFGGSMGCQGMGLVWYYKTQWKVAGS